MTTFPVRTLNAILATLFLSAASVSAEPVRLNFDRDLDGNPLTSGTLLNDAYPSELFRFATDDQVIRTGDGVPSLPNFAVGDGSGFIAAIDVFFSRRASMVQGSNVTASDWTLLAFDATDRLLGSARASDFPETASLRFPGQISHARFVHSLNATTGGFGVDDIAFDFGSNPVPEPTSVLLFATGGGALVLRLTRQRKRDALSGVRTGAAS